MFGKSSKLQKILANLQNEYQKISTDYGIPLGDFPPVEQMQEKLASVVWSTVPKLEMKKLTLLDEGVAKTLPRLMELLPVEENKIEEDKSTAGTVVAQHPEPSPFYNARTGTMRGDEKQLWLGRRPSISKYKLDFMELGPDDQGRVSGEQAKSDLVKSKLPSSVLHRVWQLADVTQDGYLDEYEYAICRHFMDMKAAGLELPNTLPSCMNPEETDVNESRGDMTPRGTNSLTPPQSGANSISFSPVGEPCDLAD
eukprot:GHVL01005853.1.p2 GENE.GHVL01005853.1~~GHVL01005853.1.p2  ORF type:complete len:254 (-),score=62.92 GHVL01005853.1:134-895(-)